MVRRRACWAAEVRLSASSMMSILNWTSLAMAAVRAKFFTFSRMTLMPLSSLALSSRV